MAARYKYLAVMIAAFDKPITFHPGQDPNTPYYMLKSNGEVIWVVIRQGKITTIFARRDNQGFDYWEDITRGNIPKENIYYMNDLFQLKRLRYSPHEKTKNVIDRLSDFTRLKQTND